MTRRPTFSVVRDGETRRVVCDLCKAEVTSYHVRRPNAWWVIPAKSAHQCPEEEAAA